MNTVNKHPIRRNNQGGNFAPPLDLDRLEHYRGIAENATPEIRESMLKLADMVEAYLDQPVAQANSASLSKMSSSDHPTGIGARVIPFDEKTVKALDSVVPYEYETEALKGLFLKLPTGMETTDQFVESADFGDGVPRLKQKMVVTDPDARDLRDAAFHLLWFAVELGKDRVPITTDMLPREHQNKMSATSADAPVTIRAIESSRPKAKKKK